MSGIINKLSTHQKITLRKVIFWWNYTTLLEHFLNGTDRLRFAPAERSGAAEFPPHPPSAAPSREAKIFSPSILKSIRIAKLIIIILTDIFNKINSAIDTTVSGGKERKLFNVGAGSIYRLIS